MCERSYGYLYGDVARSEGNVDIAKRVRADIKLAVSEGLLPSRWAYSVRSDSLAIEVEVRDCLDAWRPCDGNCRDVWCAAKGLAEYAHAARTHDVLTDEAEAARMTLRRIHGAYNHDGSEIQTDYFDVRYYGGVSFEDADTADFRRREAERLAAKKAARTAGTPKRLYRNYSRTAGSVIHLTVETPNGKEVLACGARLMRSSLGETLPLGTAEVTCSRCAKRAAA